jgi:hypothetical protein
MSRPGYDIMTGKSEKMAVKKAENKTSEAFTEEIQQMVESRKFMDERSEFSPMIRKYADHSKTTEDDGWDLMTRKIVEVLPRHLTDGIITCSLERINQEGPCRDAADNDEEELKITTGDNFPPVAFPTFYPYLDFILRAGPVDICHMKKHFKVEGSVKLNDALLQFREKKVRNVTGTIIVSAIISLCKGDDAVKLHEFKKEIEMT